MGLSREKVNQWFVDICVFQSYMYNMKAVLDFILFYSIYLQI